MAALGTQAGNEFYKKTLLSAARGLQSVGSLVSGRHEYGLANACWALSNRLREHVDTTEPTREA